MTKRELTKQAMKDFILFAKEKGFDKDSIMIIGIICSSKQMHEQGISSQSAFLTAIELIKKGLSKKKVYSELLRLTGLNEEKLKNSVEDEE